MILVYAAKLGIRPKPTNIGAQKIDGLALETHNMISACFLLQDSQKRFDSFKRLFCWPTLA